jgi:hypothetical protein
MCHSSTKAASVRVWSGRGRLQPMSQGVVWPPTGTVTPRADQVASARGQSAKRCGHPSPSLLGRIRSRTPLAGECFLGKRLARELRHQKNLISAGSLVCQMRAEPRSGGGGDVSMDERASKPCARRRRSRLGHSEDGVTLAFLAINKSPSKACVFSKPTRRARLSIKP